MLQAWDRTLKPKIFALNAPSARGKVNCRLYPENGDKHGIAFRLSPRRAIAKPLDVRTPRSGRSPLPGCWRPAACHGLAATSAWLDASEPKARCRKAPETALRHQQIRALRRWKRRPGIVGPTILAESLRPWPNLTAWIQPPSLPAHR